MPRFLIKLALFITLALTASCLAARVLGSTQPLNPVLRGFTEGCEDIPQPCWYGIVLGRITVEEAATIVAHKGYTVEIYAPKTKTVEENGCRIELYSDYDNHRLKGIIVVDCDTVYLGSLMSVIGQPDYIDVSCTGKPVAGYKYIRATVLDGTKIKPYSKIYISIALQFGEFASDEKPTYPIIFQWMGFKSLDDYYRIQPDVVVRFCGE
jgi:hypothetical protein